MDATSPTPTAPPRRKRRWLQYGLRTMLVLMVLVAVGMSYVAVTIHDARHQKQIAKELAETHADVTTAPIWLGKVLGDDSLVNVTGICAENSRWVDNGWLTQLEGLSQLQVLGLHNTAVSDAGLAHLKGLNALKELGLGGTMVTGDGFAHLEGLSSLSYLELSESKISDDSLVHLNRLSRLHQLDLRDTKITDKGAVHLIRLSGLGVLDLRNTQVTSEGAKKLQAAMPNCEIIR